MDYFKSIANQSRVWGEMDLHTLLIEDDDRVARLITLELRHAGWDVHWCDKGRDGLSEAIGGNYDVVILDLMLPDIDGIKVCQSLRQVSDTPILILTARDAVVDRVRGLDAGADDYLVKPFATMELLARMRALTRRPANVFHQDDTLTVGPLELYPMRHEVRLINNPIELTRREFDLLQYFMQNVGITLTRDMILDRVWGWGYSGASNIVDVYVGYLRQKIGLPTDDLNLVTIRGVGYVLKYESPS